jgi:hypothetical protein
MNMTLAFMPWPPRLDENITSEASLRESSY